VVSISDGAGPVFLHDLSVAHQPLVTQLVHPGSVLSPVRSLLHILFGCLLYSTSLALHATMVCSRSDAMFSSLVLLWGLLLSTVTALVTPQSPVQQRYQLERRQTCNTATNRQCWTTSPAFNINTDYETSWPTTGVTRTVCSEKCATAPGNMLKGDSSRLLSLKSTTGSAAMAESRSRQCL